MAKRVTSAFYPDLEQIDSDPDGTVYYQGIKCGTVSQNERTFNEGKSRFWVHNLSESLYFYSRKKAEVELIRAFVKKNRLEVLS